MKDDSLAGKTAIVTGARRGIGKAIALALAGKGVDIALSDNIVVDGKLREAEETAKKSGVKTLAVPCNISLQEDVARLARQTLDAFGKIDILVNCAGVWIPGQTLLECSDKDWDAVMDTNLKGTFICCREIGREMIGRKQGCIINISSQVGITPGAGAGAYPISKAGIIMLTQQLALEMAPYSVRVNALAPGIVKTDFNAAFWKQPEKEKQSSEQVPLGRLAETEDIAQAALFLASGAAGYITGETLCINGGWKPSSAVSHQ
jgi:NAD(P)-dependent dehydrogenase (short-subunit alcohol dehydrogenase family)